MSRALVEAGLPCSGVWTPSREREGRPAPEAFGLRLCSRDTWRNDQTDLVIIGCQDDVLPDVAADMARDPLPDRLCVVHLSGVLGRAALEPLAQMGVETAAVHPLKSFPDYRSDEKPLDRVFVGLEEGSGRAQDLETLFRLTGAHVLPVRGAGKAAYHAAAAMASNQVLGLLDCAEETLRMAAPGVADPREVIGALSMAAVAGYLEKGAAGALTGPVERGDLGTIERHLDALGDRPELMTVYKALTRRLTELASAEKEPADGELQRIRRLLDAGTDRVD